ncbi:MAG: hypothetical protein SFU99_18315 [Saprospiraceae bacterium]|nr:hypothetical protein [Saprospiraceae bacterium]
MYRHPYNLPRGANFLQDSHVVLILYFTEYPELGTVVYPLSSFFRGSARGFAAQ